MNFKINACVHTILCLKNILLNDIIKIIITIMMKIPNIKPYSFSGNIVIIKNRCVYDNKCATKIKMNKATYDKLSDDKCDIQLNRTCYRNVKSIHFPDIYQYKVKFDVKNQDDIVKMKRCCRAKFYLSKEGFMFSKGDNLFRCLGLGDNKRRTKYERINLSNVTKFWCGRNNMCAISNNVTYIWGCGGPYHHQYYSYMRLPQTIEINDIIKVCCGNHFGVALTKANKLYGWGPLIYHSFGNRYPEPILLDFDKSQKIINISADTGDLFILTDDGKIYTLEIVSSEEKGTLCSQFKQIQTNMMNIIKIKCVDNYVFIINDANHIQLFDSKRSTLRNIILYDQILQQNVMRNDVTLQQNVTSFDNDPLQSNEDIANQNT